MLRRSRFLYCTPSSLPTTRHVYNPFSSRMIDKNSTAYEELNDTLGISENPAKPGTLCVTRPEVLNAFAAKVREDPEVIQKSKWPKKMRNYLNGLLRSLNDDEDASQSLNEYIKNSALERLYRRDVTGAIGGIIAGGGTANDDASNQQQQQQEGSSSVIDFAPPTLLPEQQRVVDLALRGYNMFISGDAGTGKTVTLKALVTELRSKGLSVAVTATTGLAAVHLGGTTFHSFTGLGVQLADFHNSTKPMPIVDVLVVDEISMMSGGIMEKYDRFMKGERNSNEPFGGTQVIMCGDFLQLDFVLDSNTARADPAMKKHVFDIDVFKNTFVCCKLAQQVRQAENTRFADQLRSLRRATVPADLFSETSGILKIDSDRKSEYPLQDTTIRLLPKNSDAIAANKERLERLPGDVSTFVPSASAPSLPGNWSSSAILHVESHRFNEHIFRTKLHTHLLNNMPPELVHFIPKAAVVVYRMQHDGVCCRVMLPQQRPDVSAIIARIWESTISKMDAMLKPSSSSSTSASVSDASPLDASTEPSPLPVELENEAGGYTKNFRPSSKRLHEHLNANTTETVGKVVDILPSGVGLHTTDIEEDLNHMITKHPVACSLDLKIGAPVLLRVNLSNHLVNGSVGRVVDYTSATPDKLPAFMMRNPMMARALDQYVTHCRFNLGNEEPMIPLVRFNGIEKTDTPIPPWPFAVGGDVGTNYYAVDAVSIPLSLAYAFTVHKVQGLTINTKVRIELENMWKCNHILYVAMSRVKRPDQLEITGWKDDLVMAHAGALKFDKNVPVVSEIEEKFLNEKVDTLREGVRATRSECLPRATWWRLLNPHHNPERHSIKEIGMSNCSASASQMVDGVWRSGTMTGTHLNASQAKKVNRAMKSSKIDFSMGSKKKKPSLFMPTTTTASTKQHRPEISNSTSETSLSSSSTEIPMFTKQASTTTANEEQLSFVKTPEAKSSAKKKQGYIIHQKMKKKKQQQQRQS